jgi:triosephosphate isomerase (TIM)
MKKMLIAGNWKMNTNVFESVKLIEYIAGGLIPKKLKSKILVCPPFTSIASVRDVAIKYNIAIGAQNCHWEPKGAFTGEVSIPMLHFLDCSYIIIGHSERRAYFNETDDIVNKKTHAVLDSGLIPVVCIGETFNERQDGRTFEVLERQVVNGFNNIKPEMIGNIVIAYEPVWAIGTGLAATSAQVQEAHEFIKTLLVNYLGNNAQDIIVLYGGSVSPKNAKSILELKDVNGALIGGASIDPESFLSIIETAEKILCE